MKAQAIKTKRSSVWRTILIIAICSQVKPVIVMGQMEEGKVSLNWRSLETDRPDATESPVTVDRGRWQVEAAWFSHTRDDEGGESLRSWTVGEINLKYGVTEAMDVQCVVPSYVRETRTMGATRTRAQGTGDPVLRVKYNLWGNDGGSTAMGLLPSVTIPGGSPVSHGRWEGGLAVPVVWRAGDRWSLGGQLQWDRIYDETKAAFEGSFTHTMVVGVDLATRLGIYMEYVGTAGAHAYEPRFSSGVTFDLGDFLVLDAGTLVGLNRHAEDLTVFSGISFKF